MSESQTPVELTTEQPTTEQPKIEEPTTEPALTEAEIQAQEAKAQYEAKMLEAFVQKPSKIAYYQQAYDNMMVTGSPNLKWQWSWWGFFGGFGFLLYRKAYLPALVAFIVTSFVSIFPFGGFISMAVMGGISPYFIVKRYAGLKQQIETRYENEAERIEAMEKVGGFHTWVAWAALVVYSIVLLMVLTILLNAPSHTG